MKRPRASDRMYVHRRAALALFAAGCLFPLNVRGEERTRRIVLLRGSTSAAYDKIEASFSRLLESHGWVEGKNLVIDRLYTGGRYDGLDRLIDRALDLLPDLILVTGSAISHAVAPRVKTVPVVFEFGDPRAFGIANLNRPGGNATGTISPGNANSKRLEIAQALIPRLARVGFLTNSPSGSSNFPPLEMAARERGIEARVRRVDGPDFIEEVITSAQAQGDDALFVEWSGFTWTHRKRITDAMKTARVPSIYEIRDYAEVGGLISYGFDRAIVRERTAALIDKILRGASPGDLPVERGWKFELIINMNSARDLGLQVPPTLVALADEVIE